MTLDEKINRFMSETQEQRVGAWTAAPPIIRLLWLLRLDVPPPLYWSFLSDAIFSGCLFGLFFFCTGVFAFGENWRRQVVSSLISGVFFGLVMAWYSRRKANRLRLSPWGSHSAGDA